MKHPLNHRKTLGASLVGAAVLAMGLLTPVVASADSNDRVRVSIKHAATPVSRDYRRDHRYRDKHRHSHRRDRVSRRGNDSRYFVQPYNPLNFKHWWRVERRLNAYAPDIRGLNRYEVRQVLGHSYDRYLRDHRRWSKRVERRSLRSLRRDHRWDNRRDRWLTRNDYHDRNCNDRSHNHNRYRRW